MPKYYMEILTSKLTTSDLTTDNGRSTPRTCTRQRLQNRVRVEPMLAAICNKCITFTIINNCSPRLAKNGNSIVYIHCVSKKLHPFYFCNNFVDPGLICIIFGSDTPEENCNKTCVVFPTTPIFCAPTVLFKTSKLSD